MEWLEAAQVALADVQAGVMEVMMAAEEREVVMAAEEKEAAVGKGLAKSDSGWLSAGLRAPQYHSPLPSTNRWRTNLAHYAGDLGVLGCSESRGRGALAGAVRAGAVKAGVVTEAVSWAVAAVRVGVVTVAARVVGRVVAAGAAVEAR